MLLGCIGDDFTGSSDLANTLAKGGMRTVQYTGIPSEPAGEDVQAGVIALKSRSIDAQDAINQSLAALDWLKRQGCEQFFFKYCSTFDSTPKGNIGPVADALAEALDAYKVIFCPAFPGTGRSIYQGHLFVNDKLLSESGMQNHPLTPMSDSDIRRWLAHQTRFTVGHVAAEKVFRGARQITDALEEQNNAGHRHIIVDAIRDEDLVEIGKAAKGLPLITGGSGVALGLPANFGCSNSEVNWTGQSGKSIILSGSCSLATRTQVTRHASNHPIREIIAADVIENRLKPREIADWLLQTERLPLAYSSADPAQVAEVQDRYGREIASKALEGFFAEVARLAVKGSVTRIIMAGGETSGAIVEGLQLGTLEIGPEIDPGVPALRARPDLVVALKSGNFGSEDFFEKADDILSGAIK
ncbi:MAG: 3-oxo-tetronate kinase [Salaquimonas sp.]